MSVKKTRMTEAQFKQSLKKSGLGIHECSYVQNLVDENESLKKQFEKAQCDTAVCDKKPPEGLSREQFTVKMFDEIKGVANAGFHYQAFVLLGIFLKHIRYCYGGLESIFDYEIENSIREATETYKPGNGVKFGNSNHMHKLTSGARVIAIRETLEEVGIALNKAGIGKETFLKFN